MEVRKLDYEKDIDEVVNLFNRSFPNEISKGYFIWKHKDNPFGKSYGLVAIENGKIVGLRMFMKWKFTRGDTFINAIRPVDTCTDPEYRGKGIFKKLTLQGLEEIKGEYDLIFNTPNSNSINGYLKMGWKKIKTPYQYSLGFVNPFSDKKKFEIIDVNDLDLEVIPSGNRKFLTLLSQDYLTWRYRFSRYIIAKFEDQTIVVFRLDKIKGMKVLILLEVSGERQNINTYLNSLALEHGALLIYYLKDESFRKIDFPVSFKRGKQDVVFKDNESVKIKNLIFSAGDLEGIM